MKKAVVLGTFDGLHKGHRAVIASAEGYDITAVTFTLPPKAVMSGKAELLMTYEDRVKGLKKLGVSAVEPLDFSTVRNISAREFLEYIKRRYEPSLIACGFNYRFGKNASGDTELLREFCAENNIVTMICEPESENGQTVSSSALRQLIKDGHIEKAADAILGGFSFTAAVTDGDHRGRTLGFPTINQRYPDNLVKPKYGVYEALVCFDGREYKGIANIGIRPTFETEEVYSETYIKDFSGDLYGRLITLKPIRFLREERRFGSVEELKAAIKSDVDSIS